MPASVVRNLSDERKWKQAKRIAAQKGHAKDWKYVMGIFQRLRKYLRSGKKKDRA
jgi:hypothetical protein